MKYFHARSKRGAAVGVLAASVLASVLGLAPSAHAIVLSPCNAHDLREAVEFNNNDGGGNVIRLSSKCKYEFTSPDLGGDDANGDPDSALVITAPVYIAGNGATIEIGGNAAIRHMYIEVAGSAPVDDPTSADDYEVVLNNLTLKDGGVESPYSGGGAPFLAAGSIAVVDGNVLGEKLTVKDNEVEVVGGLTATGGAGGIYVGEDGDNLTLVRSTVKNNEVEAYGLTASAVSGGVNYDGEGDFRLIRSTVSGNELDGAGLVISLGIAGGAGDSAGFGTDNGIIMDESSVTGNTVTARSLIALSAGGGLVLTDGSGTDFDDHVITDSTVSGNKVTADGPVSIAVGGGILNLGELSDEGSTISGNKAVCKSDGFCLAAGGGYANSAILVGGTVGDALFTETTFKGNKAEAKDGLGAGGGLFVTGGDTILSESTVTKNEAKGAARLGGGIANFGDPLDVDIDASDVFKNKPDNCYNVPACDD